MRYQQETPRPEKDAATDLEVRATYAKKSEFAPHVTIAEETFFGHGWQPLTIAFAQALWFLPSNQTFDVPFLVSWLEQLGWKGANGKPIGANVVRRELGLLREAGYVQTHRLRGEGGKAVGIQYAVSQRRTDQPETGSWIPAPDDYRSSDHVPPMTTCGQSPHVVDGEKPSSDHVPPMTTCGQSPHVVDAAKPQVKPRGTNGVHPPHPPEEEDSSSPTPPSRPTGSLPSQREEGPEFSPEEITAAVDFLQQMQRWQAGAATARSCAPKLLRTMREQGWPSLAGADAEYRALLEAEVLKNTGGAASWTKCLPGWVRDLRRYALVHPQATPAQGSSARPAATRSVIEACPECDEYGWLLDDDDNGPQRRCTHPGVTRSEVEAAK
ncbi:MULTISPECIES: hypothetical protein [Streptomyces]|uniref:hypothetical protein n=1 Tax=Streptomyces TaxID=1883 RepID=UPI00210F0B2D|nr:MULTISPECIES: hypothetical protein [Streptomyces]UUA11610.1 hypothetical protein NNW98_39030 [Streptomyces koelreuteriae]UUA19185.1 hypothetical protein NNW99_38785 [Streptomyces sp. CRCS-T-1]